MVILRTRHAGRSRQSTQKAHSRDDMSRVVRVRSRFGLEGWREERPVQQQSDAGVPAFDRRTANRGGRCRDHSTG